MLSFEPPAEGPTLLPLLLLAAAEPLGGDMTGGGSAGSGSKVALGVSGETTLGDWPAMPIVSPPVRLTRGDTRPVGSSASRRAECVLLFGPAGGIVGGGWLVIIMPMDGEEVDDRDPIAGVPLGVVVGLAPDSLGRCAGTLLVPLRRLFTAARFDMGGSRIYTQRDSEGASQPTPLLADGTHHDCD